MDQTDDPPAYLKGEILSRMRAEKRSPTNHMEHEESSSLQGQENPSTAPRFYGSRDFGVFRAKPPGSMGTGAWPKSVSSLRITSR